MCMIDDYRSLYFVQTRPARLVTRLMGLVTRMECIAIELGQIAELLTTTSIIGQ
jgi:hypothetical protein